MAEVYLGEAVDPGELPRSVALKRLLPHLASDPQMVQMFLNEARITSQVSHPNVVRVVDFGHQSGAPYIAMELLRGRSLAELREEAAGRGQRVPLAIALRILAEACRGLDAAHDALDVEGRALGIVHRDFSPDNIHVGFDGHVKVLDFGIAQAQRLSSGTEPGMLKGKFFYMSPEMILGQPVDRRADIFAAGVMLYEQLCGRRPFTGHNTSEVMARIRVGTPKAPSAFDPSVPAALERLCLTALHREREERFPRLKELVAAIEELEGQGGPASVEQVGAYARDLFKDGASRTEHPTGSSAVFFPEPDAAAEPLLPGAKPARRRLQGKQVAAVLVAVGVLATAGVFWLHRSAPLTPEERLTRAAAVSGQAEREAWLRPLFHDPRCSAAQLASTGQLLLEAGRLEAALELAVAFAVRFPEEVQAPLLEAKAAIALRLGRRAEGALARASKLQPMLMEPDLLLAQLRELQGDARGTLEALTRAEKKEPDQPGLALRRGMLLSQQGALDEAAAVLTAVLQRQFDASATAELAFVRFRQEANGEALSLLKKALKKEPGLPIAHYYLGAALYRQGDVSGAERAYREASRLSPLDVRPLSALCEIQAQSGSSVALARTQADIRTRFPDRADSLLASCQAKRP